MPVASFADIRAIGKPVAFDANADEREVRGLISITTTLSSSRLCANCMFVPPNTPMASTIR